MKKKIEIYVACHKPAEIPENDYFVPIHVGAKNSNIQLPGMQRDDEGENISEKNPNYCEMTAQFWAWKHSDADFIGLCHYRRYLSFSKKWFTNFTPDFRKQVLVPVLTPVTERKYGLLDKSAMEDKILANDIIVPCAQDLSKVYTPFGPQKTTLGHWKAHDMALINVEDLKKLFHIVEVNYPMIYKDMMEYMNGKYFYGFNTFVMRKDLFREMCSFEFDVLSKLEEEVDISHYNQQLSRIYGFMGEILYSSFVYHIKKTRPDIKIAECQMLYFDKTDPIAAVVPKQKDAVKIIWDIMDAPEFLLYPSIKSFLSTTDSGKNYEVYILRNQKQPIFEKYLSRFAYSYKNVFIKFIDISCYIAELNEEYGNVNISIPLLLPWILKNFDKCVYLKWNTIICKDLASLYQVSLEGKPIAAIKDVYYQGRLNTFYKNDKNFALHKLGITDIFSVTNPFVLLLDLSMLRNSIPVKSLFDKAKRIENSKDKQPDETELFNALCCPQIKYLPLKWNCLAPTNGDIRFHINEAPLCIVNEHKVASQTPYIISYHPDAPWFIDGDEEFYMKYWGMIRGEEIEEIFRNHLIVRNSGNKMGAKEITWAYLNTIFPKGSHRREIIKKLFPKKRLVYRTLRKIMNP